MDSKVITIWGTWSCYLRRRKHDEYSKQNFTDNHCNERMSSILRLLTPNLLNESLTFGDKSCPSNICHLETLCEARRNMDPTQYYNMYV